MAIRCLFRCPLVGGVPTFSRAGPFLGRDNCIVVAGFGQLPDGAAVFRELTADGPISAVCFLRKDRGPPQSGASFMGDPGREGILWKTPRFILFGPLATPKTTRMSTWIHLNPGPYPVQTESLKPPAKVIR